MKKSFNREEWLEHPFRTPEGAVEVWLYDDVYGFNLHLLTRCTPEIYRKWVKRVFDIDDHWSPAHHAAAHEVLIGDSLCATVILMRGKWRADPLNDFLTLTHECYHATTYALLNRGLKHTRETDEAFAYLHESLVKRLICAMARKLKPGCPSP